MPFFVTFYTSLLFPINLSCLYCTGRKILSSAIGGLLFGTFQQPVHRQQLTLLTGHFRYETLEYQHRMRPSISRLLVPAVYPMLKDHPSVHEFPRINGLSKDIFFIEHEFHERDVCITICVMFWYICSFIHPSLRFPEFMYFHLRAVRVNEGAIHDQ